MTAVVDDMSTAHRSRWVVAGAVVAVVGLVVRLLGIDAPPFAFHATRQLYGADMARSFWVHLGGVPPAGWRSAVLASQPQVIEPPVVPAVAAVLYRLLGSEHIALVRALLAAGWVAATPAVWGASARLTGRRAAFFASAVWCLSPYGVAASRSFQPDALMVPLLAATVWAGVRDDDLRTGRSRALTLTLAAGVVFVKLVAAFYVVPLLLAFALLRRRRGDRSWRRPLVDLAVALGPGVGFLVVGMATGLLAGQEENRFFPSMLLEAGFWSHWGGNALRVGGALTLAMAIAGALWARGRAGLTLASLAVGYVAFGLAFAYHYRTHDYYHLPLVLPVALGVGVFADLLLAQLGREGASPLAAAAVVVLVGLGLVLTRSGYPYLELTHPARWDERIAAARQIGDAVDHGTRIVVSGPAYGQVEELYGGITAVAWPLPADISLEALSGHPRLSVADRLAQLDDDPSAPLTWFVIADPGQYETDPELATYLDTHFPVGARGDGWWAYRLDQPLGGG